MSEIKLQESIELLSDAIRNFKKDTANRVAFAALSKAFEVCFEYAWKYFKRCADQAGLEVYSPRDSVKAAVQLDLIEDLNLWDLFLNARNQSMHDYIGMTDKDFFPLILRFEKGVKGIIKEV